MTGSQRSTTERQLPIVALLLTIGLLGVNAAWGWTGSQDTWVSAWQRQVAPFTVWLLVALLLLLTFALVARAREAKSVAILAAMVSAWIIGTLASRWVYTRIPLPPGGVPLTGFGDLARAVLHRSFYLWPAIPMWAVYLVLDHRPADYALRFGDWRLEMRVLTTSGQPAGRQLLYWVGFVGISLFLFFQLQVGFAPLLSGRLIAVAVPVALLALFNGFLEEVIFRGFFQPTVIACLGRGFGLWAQAAFFGLHHFGSSPVPIAALPLAIVTAGLGWLWGKSVLETRGLAWAVLAHATVDFAFFAAQFV